MYTTPSVPVPNPVLSRNARAAWRELPGCSGYWISEHGEVARADGRTYNLGFDDWGVEVIVIRQGRKQIYKRRLNPTLARAFWGDPPAANISELVDPTAPKPLASNVKWRYRHGKGRGSKRSWEDHRAAVIIPGQERQRRWAAMRVANLSCLFIAEYEGTTKSAVVGALKRLRDRLKVSLPSQTPGVRSDARRKALEARVAGSIWAIYPKAKADYEAALKRFTAMDAARD